MRFIRAALLAVLIALLGVGVVAVSPWGIIQTTAGRAVLGPPTGVHPGKNVLLDPLPTGPATRWRVDAPALFGPQDNTATLGALAATPDVIIAGGMQVAESAGWRTAHGDNRIMAVGPDDGHSLWADPSEFIAYSCAFSRDARLACVNNDGGPACTIAFLDPQSGRILSTQETTVPGDLADPAVVTIRRAGDGFLVVSQRIRVEGDQQSGVFWFSSDGTRGWTHTPPPGIGWVKLSEAGNVVTVSDYDRGVQIYALDTGELLYDATDDLRKAGGPTSIYVVPNAAGFAISTGLRDHSQLALFDSHGVRRKVMTGWWLPHLAEGTEGDRIVLLGEDNYRDVLGLLSASTNRVLWQSTVPPVYQGPVLVGNDHVAVAAHAEAGHRWTVYDATSGETHGSFDTSIYMEMRGFDGQRLVFRGQQAQGQRGPADYTAFDAASGARVWRLSTEISADKVTFEDVGPFVFRYEFRSADAAASLSRLASR